MHIEQHEHADGGVAVVAPIGRMDAASVPSLRARFQGLARSGRARILIDLSRVGFVDSSGLSVLVTALKAARAAGGDVAVLRPAAQARALLELTRLHEVMTVFEDETTAVETLLAS